MKNMLNLQLAFVLWEFVSSANLQPDLNLNWNFGVLHRAVWNDLKLMLFKVYNKMYDVSLWGLIVNLQTLLSPYTGLNIASLHWQQKQTSLLTLLTFFVYFQFIHTQHGEYNNIPKSLSRYLRGNLSARIRRFRTSCICWCKWKVPV